LSTAQAARPRHEARQRWRRATWTRRKNPHDRGRSAARFSAPNRQVSRGRRDPYRCGIFRVPAGATCSTQCHGGCSSRTRGTGSHQDRPRSPLPRVAKDHFKSRSDWQSSPQRRWSGCGGSTRVVRFGVHRPLAGIYRRWTGLHANAGWKEAGTGFEASVKHSGCFSCCQAMVNHSHPRQSRALPNSECRSKGRD
jgi:hypothetical protein